MLDLKLIRQKPEWAKKKLAARAIKGEEIDELIALDEKTLTSKSRLCVKLVKKSAS